MPYYTAIGMSVPEYWEGDPALCIVYREADIYKRKRENESLWLMGNYAHIGVSIAISNAFRKSGAKPIDYPKEPFRIVPLTDAEIAEKKRANKAQTISFLNSLKSKWDKNNAESDS